MSQHTVFVENLTDASSYYHSVFGLLPNAENNHSESALSVCLSSTESIKQGLTLLLIEDESAAADALKIIKPMPAIEWKSEQFWDDYHAFSGFGVVFESLPDEQDSHVQVCFIDGYGVRWQLVGA
ncbi:hypothetical protein [Marinomonas arenicola]|uniref:VOC family protein n=1 Tax=Marinomonas arenicola TaxID=569601 RepID=A0ABU9G1Q5_9GAMM